MGVSLTDVQTDLAYLLGEQSAPSESNADYMVRATFIQRALERAYRAYDFPSTKLVATVQAVNGVATLASGSMPDTTLDVRESVAGADNDHIYVEIDYSEQDEPSASDYTYYRTQAGDAVLLNLSQTSPLLTVRYTSSTPILNASIKTPFPSSMTLARGALIYYRQAEDPQADISQEETIFQVEIDEIISQYNRSRPRPRFGSRHEARGTYIGDIGSDS